MRAIQNRTMFPVEIRLSDFFIAGNWTFSRIKIPTQRRSIAIVMNRVGARGYSPPGTKARHRKVQIMQMDSSQNTVCVLVASLEVGVCGSLFDARPDPAGGLFVWSSEKAKPHSHRIASVGIRFEQPGHSFITEPLKAYRE